VSARPVTIVGAGPLGLVLAQALRTRGQTVTVLEAGGAFPDAPDFDAEIVDPRRHPPLRLANARALGGSSWWWGGRCVPLDAIDYLPRAHMPASGWPIQAADVAPFEAEAATALGLPGARFAVDDPTGDLRLCDLELWLNEPQLARSAPAMLNGASLKTNTSVRRLVPAADGRSVRALEVSVRGGPTMQMPMEGPVVLACGGVQTTRLLLELQEQGTAHMGGADGPLGRTYMGHVSGRIADIQFDQASDAAQFAYSPVPGGARRRRITLSPDLLEREALPNGCAYPANPLLGAAEHGSGALSLLFLILSTPGIGRRLASEAIRKGQMRGSPDWGRHIGNLLSDPLGGISVLFDVAKQRLSLKRRKPFLFHRARDGRHPLHYHLEQRANPASTIRRLPGTDSLGLPRVRIDLQFEDADVDNVLRWHDVLDQRLRETGTGRLIHHAESMTARRELVWSQLSDGFHQLGTTRMGTDATDGVVDRNCRTFDLENLFVASTSVFRTSGQANPTFTGAALAVRLAEHLANPGKDSA
jgi:choline dehydrogenase-like flavoprotein